MRTIIVSFLVLMAFFSNSQSINDLNELINDTNYQCDHEVKLTCIINVLGNETTYSIGAFRAEKKDGLWINLTENCFLLSYEMYYNGYMVESCDIDSTGTFQSIRIFYSDSVLKSNSGKDTAEGFPTDRVFEYSSRRDYVGYCNGLHLYCRGKFIEVSDEFESYNTCTPLTKNGIFLLFENGRLTMTTRMKENKVNGVLREYGEFGLKKEFAYKEGFLDGMGYIYFKGNLIGCFDYSFGILFNSSRINNKIRKEGFMVDKQFVPMYYYPIVNVSGQSAFNNIFGLIGPGGKYKPSRIKCRKNKN